MNKKITDAMNDIHDEYIESAHPRWNIKKFVSWANVGKLAVCGLCLFFVINIGGNLFGGSAKYAYESAKSDSMYLYNSDSDFAYKESAASTSNSYSYTAEKESDSKLIVNASMRIETSKYDQTIENILNKMKEANGYAQYTYAYISSDNNHRYEATLRIPSENYNAFIESLKSENDVSYYSESVDDITSTYKDLEARLTALKAQEEKVLEFYAEAKSIDDLMSIESRLSDLRYQIESMESQIKNYDVLTSYATLSINVQESVTHSATITFSTRLKNSFINGWNNFVSVIENIILFFSYNVVFIVFVVVILLVGYFIYRKKRNKNRNK